MTTGERRYAVLDELKKATKPISASTLASTFGVSRQIIVGDVALLRAENFNIAATPRGYVFQSEQTEKRQTYMIACCHHNDQIREELYTVVDHGGELHDVIVEHPLYGQISGKLCIASRYDADLFLENLQKNAANPLCHLTGGVHLHTLYCPDEESYRRIAKKLKELTILFQEE